MAGGHSHPDETSLNQQPLRSLPTNLLMGSLKNHLMADGTIGNLTVTGKLQVTGAASSLAIGATPPTAANAGTGIWLDRTGLYSLLSDVYQVKIDATTGQLLAGGGNIALDANGMCLVPGTGSINRIGWGATAATAVDLIYGNGDAVHGALILYSGGSGYGTVQITAKLTGGPTSPSITIYGNVASSPDVVVTAPNGMSVTGTLGATSTITGTQLISNIATGTKPLDVTSTTVCTNLNADMCDGAHISGAYTLTMGAASAINQDVQTTAGPTFNHIHLLGGGNQRPNLSSNDGGGAVQWCYENSADANHAWAAGRDQYGNYVVEHSAGATFGAGGTVQPLKIDTSDNFTLGHASTITLSCTGRLIVRTTASDPQHATPASRPAGSVGEIAYYSGKWYGCTNAATPTWEKFTST